MATTADDTRATRTTGVRGTAALLGAGGLLIAAGGQLHPVGTGATLDAVLLDMLGNASWTASHLLVLAGLLASVAGFAQAHRRRVFGPRANPWVLAAAIGYGVAVVETVPHLLAVTDHAALAHAGHTPVLDTHVLLQIVATPAMGLTGAALAVVVARGAGTAPAWALAVLAVLGGAAYALAGPLIGLVGDPATSPLFIGAVGPAVWLVGTAVRLRRPGRRASATPAAEPIG